MFKLFSKSKSGKQRFDFSNIAVDMHSHLLPGIDDGSPDLETSVEYVKGLKALGYRKLITTPHIMWDMYRNTPEIINGKLETLKEAVKKEGIDIELHAAAEYYLDEHVLEMMANKEPMLTISGNKVLTEFSMSFPSFNAKEILFEMQMAGYHPVIAHPERYTYLQREKEYYSELKDIGCLFQLNLLSLTGQYGATVKDLALYLLKNDFYDIVGTDMHHDGHLANLEDYQVHPMLQNLLNSSKLLNARL